MEPHRAHPAIVPERRLRAVAPLQDLDAAPPQAGQRPLRTQAAPRPKTERRLLAVLLLSLALTLGAFLTADSISRLDALFAAVILLSGLSLLALVEISGTGGPPGNNGGS